MDGLVRASLEEEGHDAGHVLSEHLVDLLSLFFLLFVLKEIKRCLELRGGPFCLSQSVSIKLLTGLVRAIPCQEEGERACIRVHRICQQESEREKG